MHVLIVDDSALYRKILSESAGSLPDVTTVAVSNGELALGRIAAEKFDLVLLDVFLPETNGLEVLQLIKRNSPQLPVVMVSGATGRDAEITLNALSKGAMDFIAKPTGPSFESGLTMLRGDIRRIIDALRIRATVRSHSASATSATSIPATPRPVKRSNPPPFIDLLLIGVSTGGPKALAELLPILSADMPVPVLIVQHMPPVFTLSLAAQLDKTCKLTVSEAPTRHPLVAGQVLIAPGGMHLEVVRTIDGRLETRHSDSPAVHSCKPSVDVLFQSAARAGLRGAVAVVLTGMGSDGADGVAALKTAIPTWCIAQNAETCAVYGMPQAVTSRGLDDESLPLRDIGNRINRIFRVSA